MSINKTTLQKLAKQYAPQETELKVMVGDKEVTIKVKRVLTLAEYIAAVNSIADMQFITTDDGKEIYAPYLHQFAERYGTVMAFTDLDLSLLRKQSDNSYEALEPIWEFLFSNVYGQIEEILQSLKSPAENTTSNYWDVIGSADEMVEMRRKQIEPSAATLWNALDELVDEIKQSFGEMTPEDMEETRAAIKKLTKLDEGKIVELMRP